MFENQYITNNGEYKMTLEMFDAYYAFWKDAPIEQKFHMKENVFKHVELEEREVKIKEIKDFINPTPLVLYIIRRVHELENMKLVDSQEDDRVKLDFYRELQEEAKYGEYSLIRWIVNRTLHNGFYNSTDYVRFAQCRILYDHFIENRYLSFNKESQVRTAFGI